MRQVIVLSVALFVALVASYVTWTDEGEELDDTEVAMYRAQPDDITAIRWQSDKSTTTITRKSDEKGEYYDIETVQRREKKIPLDRSDDEAEPEDAEEEEPADAEEEEPADAEEEEEPAEEEEEPADAEDEEAEEEPKFEIEVEETESHFIGNDQAAELWNDLAPLYAMRELVVDEDTDTEVFGLEEPTATIVVARGDKEHELTVGAETYGSKDLYVGYAGRVFLVDNKTLQPLEFAAQRLVERSLHPVSEKDAESLELEWADGTQRTWTHEERAPQEEGARPKQVWVADDTPDEADEAAATWIDKLLRLRLRTYLDEEEEQALTFSPVFEVTLKDSDDEAWRIEVFEAESEGQTNWYARTDYNRSVVLLTESLARGVAEDLDNLRP